MAHRALEELARKFGPLMYMRLGTQNYMFASSADMAREILRVHDAEFLSRPLLTVGKYVGLDYTGITFSSNEDCRRLLRKLCTTEVLSASRLKEISAGRHEEAAFMVKSILEISGRGELVTLRPIVDTLTWNNMYQIIFGKHDEKTSSRSDVGGIDIDSEKLRKCVMEALALGGTFNIGDFIPALAPFDLQGVEKRMKRMRGEFEEVFSRILIKWRAGLMPNGSIKGTGVKPFLDVLLDQGETLDSKSIMAVVMNLLAGGTNTTATSLEWGVAELIHYPHILKKVHEELDRVVGRDRLVQEADLPNLPYLQAFVKETFRLHPPIPMTLPHRNLKAVCVQGYDIPANSNVMVNIFAIGRDPASWENPNEFNPDRFLCFDKDTATPTVRSTGFELLTFGYGRRGCVGMNLGSITMQFGLATLVQAFDWSPAPGVDHKSMTMVERYQADGPIAEPVIAVVTPRLESSLC
jgi:cytochrome P450